MESDCGCRTEYHPDGTVMHIVNAGCKIHCHLVNYTFIPQFHGGNDRQPARYVGPSKNRRANQ